jgi:hypothetical protein
MTRKQKAIARASAWKQALIEGRVVKTDEQTLTAYRTIEQAQAAVKSAWQVGLNAEIVIYPSKTEQ